MPFDGHFKPLTGIAACLKELGHDVRWYAGPTYAGALEALGIEHLPYRRANEVNGDNIGELFPERARLSGPKLIAFEFENVFVANCEAHFRDIEEIRREFPFDALIADEGLYAIKLVAEKLGVPVYAVGVGPLMFNSPHVPPNFFGLKPARSPIGRIRDRVVGAMVNSTMKPGAKRFNDLLEAQGLEPLPAPRDFFDIPAEASTTFLQSGVPGFEWPRPDLPSNVRFVGPLLPHRPATAFQDTNAIEGAESLIVVSQGTVDNKDPEKLLAPALEALSGTEHLVVAATGGCNSAQLRERFPADNVVVEDFVDFAQLFPRTRLFVCNGGYGSVMLALANGAPILSAGKREGKNDINARVDYFGVGVDLRSERPSPAKVAKGVARILADPGYAERARRLRDELRSYEPLDLVARELAA
jgi:MGT family glycosyltransferase